MTVDHSGRRVASQGQGQVINPIEHDSAQVTECLAGIPYESKTHEEIVFSGYWKMPSSGKSSCLKLQNVPQVNACLNVVADLDLCGHSRSAEGT